MKFNDKLSSLISSQLPEFVVADHPKFAQFLKTYYTFLESVELGVNSVQTTDGILLETETNQENLLLLDAGRKGGNITQLDAGDKVLQETSIYGKFTNGETITGQTSKATAVIVAEDLANGRLFSTSQNKLQVGETIVGASSNASAVISSYKENPVKNISDLVSYRDPDTAISSFLTNFRDEFLATIPENLATGIDKRSLIKNIKSLYRLKGTAKGNEIFFRILFGENSETIYPRESLLRVSDGKFDSRLIIRAINDGETDTVKLIGRTITGQTSEATAIVENVFKYSFGQYSISEFTINAETSSGTFQIGENVRGTESDDTDTFIKATITGIPGDKTITNDGALNEVNDKIVLTGGGIGGKFLTNQIGSGKIDEIIIDDGGFDFEIGDKLVFDNDGTEGGGAQGFVSVVNGGFGPQDGNINARTLFPINTSATSGIKFLDGPVLAYDPKTIQTGFNESHFRGTINDADDGTSTANVKITGSLSQAEATIRFTPFGTLDGEQINTDPDHLGEKLIIDFNPNVLYITYTTLDKQFQKGEVITVQRAAATETINTTITGVSPNRKYNIGGVDAPTLTLYEGNTYIINHSSGHPFEFSTTPDGTHGGGVEYTNGVTKPNSTSIQIVVPVGAPTLYYYCAIHAGMGGQANTVANNFTARLRKDFGREEATGPEATIADRDSVYQMLRNLSDSIEADDHIVLEDETGVDDFYSGNKIVQERNTGVGDITDIFTINEGNGYKRLPKIGFTLPDGTTTSSGKDFKLKCFGSQIGRIVEIATIEHGIRYEQPPSPPSIEFINNSIVTGVSGIFGTTETVTGATSGFTGKVVSYDEDRGLLKLENVTGGPVVGEIINGAISGAQGRLHITDHASATVAVTPLTATDGVYINEDGHISEDTKKIQDSLLYQDYSYIVKVGESINTWRDSFKKTMHSAGFYFTGRVTIENRIQGGLRFPVRGVETGLEESPLFGLLNTIFSTMFGRRMGTDSDGTTLRANPLIDVSAQPVSSPSPEHFAVNTRDTTVRLNFKVTGVISRIRREIKGFGVRQGFAYSGPRWQTLNRLHNTSFVTGNNASNITFKTLHELLIHGTRTGLDGTNALFTTVSTPNGKLLKCNFAIPAQVSFSKDLYSTALKKWDTSALTFDDTTP